MTQYNIADTLQKARNSKTFAEWQSQTTFDENCVFIEHLLEKELVKTGRQAIWDKEAKRLYRLMALYFCNEAEFEKNGLQTDQGFIPYHLRKGILLIGNPGRSKSFVFRVFNLFCNSTKSPNKFRSFISKDIADNFAEKGSKALNDYINYNAFQYGKPADIYYNMYIDELGVENISVKNFGNKFNPLTDLIDRRYRVFIDNQKVTHTSSNLKLKDLENTYGARIYSRLFEMFNVIITSGDDMRIQFRK